MNERQQQELTSLRMLMPMAIIDAMDMALVPGGPIIALTILFQGRVYDRLLLPDGRMI